MSDREDNLLATLGIAKSVVAKALKVSRQGVVKAMGDKSRDYLTPMRLVLISTWLTNHKGERLGQLFEEEALKRLGPAAEQAFGKPALEVRIDPIELQVQGREALAGDTRIDRNPAIRGAREMWFFASRPRELERPGYLQAIASTWFRQGKPTSADAPIRVVYFTSPDVGRTLGKMFLRVFDTIPEKLRNPVYLFESSALSICPRFVITNPLPDEAEGWAFGQEDHQLFKMAQSNTRHIVETLRRAGILGFTEFMAEDFNSQRSTVRDFPDFSLRFVSSDLARSRVLLGDRSLEVVSGPKSSRKT